VGLRGELAEVLDRAEAGIDIQEILDRVAVAGVAVVWRFLNGGLIQTAVHPAPLM
jgi:hypothetical protein